MLPTVCPKCLSHFSFFQVTAIRQVFLDPWKACARQSSQIRPSFSSFVPPRGTKMFPSRGTLRLVPLGTSNTLFRTVPEGEQRYVRNPPQNSIPASRRRKWFSSSRLVPMYQDLKEQVIYSLRLGNIQGGPERSRQYS